MRYAWLGAAALGTLGIGTAIWALVAARNAAIDEAAWLRQRLADKRVLVHRMQTDLAEVTRATERVSQMASIARAHNTEVRRMTHLEEAGATAYTPMRLAALDDAALERSDDAARALTQLAFLEEQLAATTDSIALLAALARPAPEPRGSETRPRTEPREAVSRMHATWPVEGEMTSRFGWRDSPYGDGVQRHTGLDIRAPYGTPVHTSAPGVVVFAGRDTGGYGAAVVVDHGRDVKTLYGHLSAIYVRQGERIGAGTAIGAVGNSGRATGVHLHFEVRVGDVPVDPMRSLRSGQFTRVASAR
jgi:murein DD-endopeptidase MepM/ murein hydrolase activator NlpD